MDLPEANCGICNIEMTKEELENHMKFFHRKDDSATLEEGAEDEEFDIGDYDEEVEDEILGNMTTSLPKREPGDTSWYASPSVICGECSRS